MSRRKTISWSNFFQFSFNDIPNTIGIFTKSDNSADCLGVESRWGLADRFFDRFTDLSWRLGDIFAQGIDRATLLEFLIYWICHRKFLFSLVYI